MNEDDFLEMDYEDKNGNQYDSDEWGDYLNPDIEDEADNEPLRCEADISHDIVCNQPLSLNGACPNSHKHI